MRQSKEIYLYEMGRELNTRVINSDVIFYNRFKFVVCDGKRERVLPEST